MLTGWKGTDSELPNMTIKCSSEIRTKMRSIIEAVRNDLFPGRKFDIIDVGVAEKNYLNLELNFIFFYETNNAEEEATYEVLKEALLIAAKKQNPFRIFMLGSTQESMSINEPIVLSRLQQETCNRVQILAQVAPPGYENTSWFNVGIGKKEAKLPEKELCCLKEKDEILDLDALVKGIYEFLVTAS